MIKFWNHSTMETYFGDKTALDSDDCRVKPGDESIEVVCRDTDEEIVYKGVEEVSEFLCVRRVRSHPPLGDRL